MVFGSVHMRNLACLILLLTQFNCSQLPFLKLESKSADQNNLLGLLFYSIFTGPNDDLTNLSDEFEVQNLESWNIYNNESTSRINPTQIEIDNGKLQLTPNSQTLWFNSIKTGAMVSKMITGNFVATTSIQVRRRTNNNLPPNQTVELAGLMVRNRETPEENYLFIVLGYDENDLSVEVKTTSNNISAYIGPSLSNSDGELRICRIGQNFYLYLKTVDGNWVVQNHPTTNNPVFIRSDLPSSVEVGPNIYANQGTPDVTSSFEYVRFFRPKGLEDCTR